MILKKVKITNYRQLQNVELDMQDSLTVLAGPNNSGKTTLISVLKGMFCDKKLSFNYSDSKTTMDIYARVKYNKPEELFEVVNDALNQENFDEKSPISMVKE